MSTREHCNAFRLVRSSQALVLDVDLYMIASVILTLQQSARNPAEFPFMFSYLQEYLAAPAGVAQVCKLRMPCLRIYG
jgi:hypothetical protein